MGHQLVLLVWKKKICLFSEVSLAFWLYMSPWIFLSRSSQFMKGEWSGRSPISTRPDAAVCPLLPPTQGSQRKGCPLSLLDTALPSLNLLPSPLTGSAFFLSTHAALALLPPLASDWACFPAYNLTFLFTFGQVS